MAKLGTILNKVCTSKERHLTELDAKIAARWYKTKLTAYRCPICNFWHLTKKNAK